MIPLSPADLARAVQLIQATAEHERVIPILGRQIAMAQAAVDAAAKARSDATNFTAQPDNLANLWRLLRQPDAALRRAATTGYRHLLADMLHPPLGGPPRQVDFHALTAEARPFLLAPFLKYIVNGTFPYLDTTASDPARGLLTYVVTSGAASAAELRQLLPTASAWLGDHWTLDAATATTFTLKRQTPLPAVIPFDPGCIRPGFLFLGLDVATHAPVYAPFADVSHMLITGTVGMGKSVAHASIALSLLASMNANDRVYAVDPGGVAFHRYAGRDAKFTVHSKPEDLWTIAANLVAIMERREAELAPAGKEKLTSGYHWLVIDEFPAYGTPDSADKATKERHQAFLGHIMALARRGRKSAIRLVFTVQEPTDRDISTGLRSVLPGILAFRTPVQAHATNLFGELTGLPADPRMLTRGQALYRDGASGEITHVQFPLITAPNQEHGP